MLPRLLGDDTCSTPGQTEAEPPRLAMASMLWLQCTVAAPMRDFVRRRRGSSEYIEASLLGGGVAAFSHISAERIYRAIDQLTS